MKAVILSIAIVAGSILAVSAPANAYTSCWYDRWNNQYVCN